MRGLVIAVADRYRHPLVRVANEPFVFVHIPKTAGTSIMTALGITKKRHLTVREIVDEIGADAWRGAFTFAFVRNPWDRVVSDFRYRVKRNYGSLRDCPIPFRDWVLRTYGPDRDPIYFDHPRMFASQREWLAGASGAPDVDLVGRFEDLEADFARIADRLGIRHALPHRNATPRVDYRLMYDATTRDLVGRWYADDVETFGYRF